VEQVNDLLPQTQCAQCGYPGCRPYAAAVVEGSAAINLCPPGGDDTIRRLARLLGRELIPLAESVVPAVAVIDEPACIGCYHCRNACPVDAIVGAHQFMHTVIASECTGCELCVAPCPVDCITMSSLP
jgi:electron transport complex protein RnfB